MSSTNFDLVINGVKARIAQVPEGGGGYKRRSVRKEIQQQIISQSENPAYRNRDDGVALLQTSWAGGSRWWKPLITSQDLASYFQSNHMDLWSEPGKIVPGNKHTSIKTPFALFHDACVVATDGTDVYAIGFNNTQAVDGYDALKWVPANNAFVTETGYTTSGETGGPGEPIAMVYDSTLGYFYLLQETVDGTGAHIGKFSPSLAATYGSDTPETKSVKYGANLVTSPYGLFYCTGGDVVEVSTGAGTPTFTVRFTPTNEEFLTRSNTNILDSAPLFISTPQGLYLARNTLDGDMPVATIYRIDRDGSGSFVGNPVAVLPRGTVALSIMFHMGQLLIASTPDWRDLADGNENLEVVIYFVGEGGMGSLGSVLGGRDEKDETPYYFLGSEGGNAYLAGSKRLWVFDAIRGGLHPAWEWENLPGTAGSPDGGYKAMTRVQDSDGDEVAMFLGKWVIDTVKVGDTDDPDTVAAFGDDETHYVLESNYFDGGLPMELKEITEVAILRDKDDGGSEWTVQVSADGGAFADVLVSAGTGVFDKVAVSGITGYQFRYKLIYQTKDTTRSALRSVLVTMATGDMVTEWDVTLDGSELLNMDNERQDPKVFADSMVSLGSNSSIVALIDNYQDHERTADISGSGMNVKVVAVEISKDTPGESLIRVLLREA